MNQETYYLFTPKGLNNKIGSNFIGYDRKS